MSDRKAVIKNADMGEEMQQDAVDCATQALEKYNIEKVSMSCFSFFAKGLNYRKGPARARIMISKFPLQPPWLCLR